MRPISGTVFKVNTDGTGFALVRSFAGPPADGGTPYGSLVVSGSTLYGMTWQGGASGRGTVFKVNTDGTGFALVRSFACISPMAAPPTARWSCRGPPSTE